MTDFFALWSTEILYKLKHLRSGPEHYFMCPLLSTQTQNIISRETVRVGLIADQLGIQYKSRLSS